MSGFLINPMIASDSGINAPATVNAALFMGIKKAGMSNEDLSQVFENKDFSLLLSQISDAVTLPNTDLVPKSSAEQLKGLLTSESKPVDAELSPNISLDEVVSSHINAVATDRPQLAANDIVGSELPQGGKALPVHPQVIVATPQTVSDKDPQPVAVDLLQEKTASSHSQPAALSTQPPAANIIIPAITPQLAEQTVLPLPVFKAEVEKPLPPAQPSLSLSSAADKKLSIDQIAQPLPVVKTEGEILPREKVLPPPLSPVIEKPVTAAPVPEKMPSITNAEKPLPAVVEKSMLTAVVPEKTERHTQVPPMVVRNNITASSIAASSLMPKMDDATASSRILEPPVLSAIRPTENAIEPVLIQDKLQHKVLPQAQIISSPSSVIPLASAANNIEAIDMAIDVAMKTPVQLVTKLPPLAVGQTATVAELKCAMAANVTVMTPESKAKKVVPHVSANNPLERLNITPLKTVKTPVVINDAPPLNLSTVNMPPPPANTMATTSLAATVAATVAQTGLDESINTQDKNWLRAFNQQIILQLDKGIVSAQIHLKPLSLGAIDIEINMQQDSAAIVLHAAKESAKHLLEQALPRLQAMMAEQGVQLQDVRVEDQNNSPSTAQYSQKQESFQEQFKQQQSAQEKSPDKQAGEEDKPAIDDAHDQDVLLDYYA